MMDADQACGIAIAEALRPRSRLSREIRVLPDFYLIHHGENTVFFGIF
jgi:hypothetical protein